MEHLPQGKVVPLPLIVGNITTMMTALLAKVGVVLVDIAVGVLVVLVTVAVGVLVVLVDVAMGVVRNTAALLQAAPHAMHTTPDQVPRVPEGGGGPAVFLASREGCLCLRWSASLGPCV